MQRFLIAMLLCLGLVSLAGSAEAQYVKQVSGYLTPGKTMTFFSRTPSNTATDTIYQISGTFSVSGTLNIQEGAEVWFLPNGRVIDSAGGVISADGFTGLQRRIVFRGQPVNNLSTEWGHFLILPGASRAYFANCRFTNFRKLNTVDTKFLYGTSGTALTNSQAITALSNGTGGVMTTFSRNTYLYDIIADSNVAMYRGGAFAFLQAPTASYFPTDDGRLALANSQVRRLTIRDTRVLNTDASTGSAWDTRNSLGGAIYISARPGATSADFVNAYLGNRRAPASATGGAAFDSTLDQILLERCVVNNTNAPVGANGTATGYVAKGGGIYVGNYTSLTTGLITCNSDSAIAGTPGVATDRYAWGGAIAVSATSGNPLFIAPPAPGFDRLPGLKIYKSARFAGNVAGMGGAIHMDFGATSGPSLNIDAENFGFNSFNNSVRDSGLITFVGNVAYNRGGAIYAQSYTYITGYLAPQNILAPGYLQRELRVKFTNNVAGIAGGSVCLDNSVGQVPAIVNRRVWHDSNSVNPLDSRVNRASLSTQVIGGGAEYVGWKDSTFATEYHHNYTLGGNGGAVLIEGSQGALSSATAVNRYFAEDQYNASNVTVSPLPFDPRQLTRFCDNHAYGSSPASAAPSSDSVANIGRGNARGGAMYIHITNKNNPIVAQDSTFISRVRFEKNYAFTGSAIYSDNFDLRLVASTTLIANNHTTSPYSLTTDLVNNGISNPSDSNASATVWGELEGPLPALESNSRGNAIYDNTARYIIRLPRGPVGSGGVDTLRGNFWGDTGPDLITLLPLGGIQRTFFIDYYRQGCYTNVYEPNQRPAQPYTATPIGTIPDTLLMEGRIYDIFDAGTDVKTADYNPRRLAIQEAFALGIPTDLNRIHRFTRDIFDTNSAYISRIRQPLQTDFTGPHPIGYPLFLQADVPLSDTNRDMCASNYTVLYVINMTTNEFVRVNAKEVGIDDSVRATNGATQLDIARYQGRLDFIPDSSAATRNPNGRAKVLYTLSLLRPQTMTFAEIQRASMLEDSAALDGRKYMLGATDYNNGVAPDSVYTIGLVGNQTWYGGERYHTLPVRPGDNIAVISRTQLWKYGAAGAISKGLQFVIGDVLPPNFTSDIATLSSDVINPNRRFLREDNVYTADPNGTNANSILFRVGAFDQNNFYDPRFQFDASRYTQLSFQILGRQDSNNTRIAWWLHDTTLFNQNVGGSNGYIRLYGNPHNPDVVPGGEPVTVRVTNFPPNVKSEGGLLGQGLPFGSNLGPDSLHLSMWTFPPYMNCPTGFQSDTLGVRSTTTTYTFRIFVQDSLPVFTSSPSSACAANLTDSLRYTYDVNTDDEAEDSAAQAITTAAGHPWDFRYGRTTYSLNIRPNWMRQSDNDAAFRTTGMLNLRINAADILPQITPTPQVNGELNLDTVISITADDGHTGLTTQKFHLPINVEPQIITNALPNAKEDFDYSLDFHDTSLVNRIKIFDANFGDFHTFKLVYTGTVDTEYRDAHYKTGQQIITGTTPTWLKIDPVSGVLYGTPGQNDAPHGPNGCSPADNVIVVVQDNCGLTAVKTFQLIVDSTNHAPTFYRGPRTFCAQNNTNFCDTLTVTDVDLTRTSCYDSVLVNVISPAGFTANPPYLTSGASATRQVAICGKFTKDDAYFSQNPLVPDTIAVAVTDAAGRTDTVKYAVFVGDQPTFQCAIQVSNLDQNRSADLQKLCFGAGRFGTDSTDIRYCEFEEPPPGPAAVFDARWELPIGGQIKGTYLDIRRDTAQFSTVTWQVRFQAGNESGSFLYPVKICWAKSCFDNTGSFKGQFYLQNPFSTAEFSINMHDGTGPLNQSLYSLESVGSDSLCLVIRNVGLQNARIVFVPEKSSVSTAPAANTFALEQNYPNPFNPSTTINFAVANRSLVHIEVYDMKGALVKSLVNEELEAGNYPVTWDGTDNAGAVVPSGTYVAKMTAGTFTSSIKMTLKK